jgi:6-phosphogluconate dehydrogenase (decarboxylating)
MRQSGPTGNPDYAIWRQVPDSVLTDLGHNVTSLFASYDGTVACVNVNSLDWGKDASTDNCEEALFQTVTFLDKTGTTSGMNTSHEGNLFLIGAATAAYLQ